MHVPGSGSGSWSMANAKVRSPGKTARRTAQFFEVDLTKLKTLDLRIEPARNPAFVPDVLDSHGQHNGEREVLAHMKQPGRDTRHVKVFED